MTFAKDNFEGVGMGRVGEGGDRDQIKGGLERLGGGGGLSRLNEAQEGVAETAKEVEILSERLPANVKAFFEMSGVNFSSFRIF